MNISRKFDVVAHDGKIAMSERVIMPLPISLQTAKFEFNDLDVPTRKCFDICVNGEIIFSGESVEGELYSFDPPLKLPAGWPTFEVKAYPYPEGTRVVGKVKLKLSVT